MAPTVEHDRENDETTTRGTTRPASLSTDDLRRAAASLSTRDGARRLRMLPIPKRLMAALHEDAFPAQPRGLAYPEEIGDILRFLSLCSPPDTSTEAIAHAALALAESYAGFDLADPKDRALLDYLRAVATYFVRIHAVKLAETLAATEGQEP